HADQRFVTQGAGMHDGGMADGDKIPDQAGKFIREMDDGIVLDIGVMADGDAVYVTPHDGVVPHAGIISDSDVSQDHGAVSDINPFAEGRFSAQEFFELSSHVDHVFVKTQSSKPAKIKPVCGEIGLENISCAFKLHWAGNGRISYTQEDVKDGKAF